MEKYGLNDTIAAIATGVGEAGIGIVRVSGKDALSVADKVFASKDGKKPSEFKTYTVHYGFIVDPRSWILDPGKTSSIQHLGSSIQYVDEALLTVMRSPKSYTKEDVVEINCHGGIVPLRRVLDLALENGARLAMPGEFTQRAFLNGRIDLSQAEAVLDIIRAKTDLASEAGIRQLKGALSAEINTMRKILLDNLAVIEANIDFPEEEIGAANLKEISGKLNRLDYKLKDMLSKSKHGRILREGISAVICGKANAGKSSLLNALLKEERSIVTSVAGTTRDTIEEIIDIRGIPVKIADTAGIIEPRDLIEEKAVRRTKKYIDSADLAILVFDAGKRLSEEDETLIKKLKKKAVLAVINKIDLKPKIQKDKILKNFHPVIALSAKKNKNINLLEDAIVNLIYNGKANLVKEPVLVGNLRHIEELRKAQKLIADAINSLDNKLPVEFIAQSMKDALLHLDTVLGKHFSEDLLDKIFSEFCIGK